MEDPASSSAGNNRMVTLRQVLATRFSETELRDLCFDLGVDYESLPGESKADRARELVAYFARRHRLTRLIRAIHEARSDINIDIPSLPNNEAAEQGEQWIPMPHAIDLTGYGSTYLTKLAQESIVPARQINGVWYFETSILLAHVQGWVTTREASELTDYTIQHIRWLARQGLVRAHKIHGEWLIQRASLLAYCARRGRLSEAGHRVAQDISGDKG